MLIVRSLVFLVALAVLSFGQTVTGGAQRTTRTGQTTGENQNYVQVQVGELLTHPAEYEGRRVTLTAEIVSVNARRHSLEVYDQQSRAQLGVSLEDLPKTQRRRLVKDPVYHVAVFGRVEVTNGRPQLKAEQVMPVELTLAER